MIELSRLKSSTLFFLAVLSVALPIAPIQAGTAAGSNNVSAQGTALEVVHLRCEYKENPVGIDIESPRFSWEIRSSIRGTTQTAYQIRVGGSPETLESDATWDSGRVESAESIQRTYEGPRLESSRRYYWAVRAWDQDGQVSAWSVPAFFEMALLSPSEWKSDWITGDAGENARQAGPALMFRYEFSVDGGIRSARAYATCLGLYEMEINGQRVGDQVLTPGWTSYNKRLQYQTYDITGLLRSGRNAIGATVGDGWYRGNIGWRGDRHFYGDKAGLLVQLRIEKEDGSVQWVGTNPDWKQGTGPIRMSEIYAGETYDARLEKEGWTLPGYNDRSWKPVAKLDHSREILVAAQGPPVRKIQEIRPVEILKSPAGETIFDMGQNMVGWIRLNVRGKKGRTITLRHAEVLDPDGNLYTENLRKAAQTVRYTMRGRGPEVFEPHFTFQGFRYVAVEGLRNPTLDNLTGIVIHSDMTRTGFFETSKDLINQLQHNIVWGQKGNFVDVPTDCPQRDERMGWTGDAQVFAETAAFNMDVAAFFTKWLKDVAADQTEEGRIPHVVPDVLGNGGSAAWADAGVIIPWTIYVRYGDRRILEQQYESMKKWVQYVQKRAGDDYIWDGDFHYGDWLAYATTRSDYPGATTDKDLIATAFFAYSTSLLEKTANVLGRQEDAREYARLLEKIQQAFLSEYVTPRGRLSSNTQTAYTLALHFDLLPQELRTQAAERLAEDVRRFENHITTGFVGTPYICHVLSRFGHLDAAYDLLDQETYPSWLYPVKQGATTIWERWDGIRPDGTFQDPGMNSFNHYAYGAIGSWLYGVIAGIRPDPARPGFKHVIIEPEPGGGFTHAEARLDSMYGPIQSDWSIENGQFVLEVLVPANSSATIYLPNADPEEVMESGQPAKNAAGIRQVSLQGKRTVVEAGSGQYRFSYRWRAGTP